MEIERNSQPFGVSLLRSRRSALRCLSQPASRHRPLVVTALLPESAAHACLVLERQASTCRQRDPSQHLAHRRPTPLRPPAEPKQLLASAPSMAYFFSTPVDIDIVLDDGEDRTSVDVKFDKNRREKVPLYFDGESIKGAVTVRPKDGKRLEHTGIKVQFIGTIG